MTLTLNRRQLISFLIIIGILLALPLVIFLSQRQQDIRPKAALPGVANFLLNADTLQISPGGNVNVLVSMQLTDPTVRSSGVDFLLLYDKSLLTAVTVTPNLSSGYTQAILVQKELAYAAEGGTFNFVRVALISTNPSTSLPTGTIPLATVTFQGKAAGQAMIKYPDDNSKLQVVGGVF